MGASGKPSQAEPPILAFDDATGWERWLEENHATSSGAWLRFARKGSGEATVTYAEAVEVALCFGWIDGQAKRLDERAWIQKFTPRRPKSVWSRINRERAEALMRQGRMRPAGLAAIEAARADGRWDAAYDSPANATIPDDLRTALEASPTARANFEALNGTNRYAILFRLQTAKKPETRQRRLEKFITMLERGEKLYP